MIVGLGNPGREYEMTRHNTGFMVVDELADKLGATFEDKRYGLWPRYQLRDARCSY